MLIPLQPFSVTQYLMNLKAQKAHGWSKRQRRFFSDVDLCVCVSNPPDFAQVGSLLRITWFPTTISRDRALVTATLNLCRRPVREGQEARNDLTNDLSNVFPPQKCKTFNLVSGELAGQTFSFERNPMLKSWSSLT